MEREVRGERSAWREKYVEREVRGERSKWREKYVEREVRGERSAVIRRNAVAIIR